MGISKDPEDYRDWVYSELRRGFGAIAVARVVGETLVMKHAERAALLAFIYLLFAVIQAAGRIIEVDRRGGAECKTLSEAVALVQPGDTISLKPGSGPYREALYIDKSGTQEQPIVFEGNGETITGFDPLTFVQDSSGHWTVNLGRYYQCDLELRGFEKLDGKWVCKEEPKAWPFVLCYRGQRIWQQRETGFPDTELDINVSKQSMTLTLGPDVDPNGWEISARYSVVKLLDVSHHVYRDIIASGAMNDGFNLHGIGASLIFENIVGCNNFDEGFSAHDTIQCRVDGGRFYGNDNGIANVGDSKFEGSEIICDFNSGYGFYHRTAVGSIESLLVSNNGSCQFKLSRSASVSVVKLKVVPPTEEAVRWIRTQESLLNEDSLTIEIGENCNLVVADFQNRIR